MKAKLPARSAGERAERTNPYPPRTNRRKKCVTILNVFQTAQPIAARSVRGSSASSGTTPGEPLSVQRSVLTASGSVERATAVGYVDFRSPETGRGEILAAIFRNPGSRSKEIAE
jgi:hypothetical protein